MNNWMCGGKNISMIEYSIVLNWGTTLVNTCAVFALQVDPSGLPAHLAAAGTFLDAAGAVQEAYCPAIPRSSVQPVQVFSVGDQLPQEIPDPGLHMLPGTGTTHIPGPLQLGSLEASYQLDSGTFPDMPAGMTQLSGYHANSSTEPVVVVQEYQPYQQHQYPMGQQAQWYNQACNIMTHNWGLPPGMHLSDLPSQPGNFVADHAADINGFATREETTGSPAAQATITNADHSPAVHEGVSCTNKLPEVSRQVPQQPTTSSPARQGAEDSDDASTNNRLHQKVQPVKSVKESHPTRFDKDYPVAGARWDAEAVSEYCRSFDIGPDGVVMRGECRREVYAPSFLHTLSAASAAEELERIDNPNKPSRDMQRDEQVFSASYHNPDSSAVSLQGTQHAPCTTVGMGVFCSPALTLQGTQQCAPNVPCATTGMGAFCSPSPGNSDDNKNKTGDDDVEITYDPTDARFYSLSFTQDEWVRNLVKMWNPPDQAEFNSDIAREDINHFANLIPLMYSRGILDSGSPPSRTMWEAEEVIKIVPNSLDSGHKRIGCVVTQYTACPDEEKPMASTLSPPMTGRKSAKKRKLPEVHEFLPDFPPQLDSSKPKRQKCCCRDGGFGGIKKVYKGPSIGDLIKPPCARFLDRLDGIKRPDKYTNRCCCRERGLAEITRAFNPPFKGDFTKRWARFLDRIAGRDNQGKHTKKPKAFKKMKLIRA